MSFIDPARQIYGIVLPPRDQAELRGKSIFVQETYNGLGNGAFLAVVADPRISNLRVVNTLISSTPAASTNLSFIISNLLTHFNFVQ